MAPKRRKVLPVIGWRERVALPELGIDQIKCKVDTGARTSALHAFDVHIEGTRSRRTVRFKVHPDQRDSRRTVEARAPLVAVRRVKSSTGHAEERPVICTPVRILGQLWDIEITLTRRDSMGFRMLLGRQAIRKRFLVHPGRSFLGDRTTPPTDAPAKGHP